MHPLRWLLSNLFLVVGLGAALGLSGAAQAADGDDCSDSATYYQIPARAGYTTQQCIVLCDGKEAGATTCAEFQWSADGAGGEVPDLVTFHLARVDSACSATPEATVNTHAETGPTGDATEAVVVALASDGTILHTVYDTAGILDFVSVDVGDVAACAADGVDVVMVTYSAKNEP